MASANAMATLGKNLAADQTDFIKNYQFAVKNGLQRLPFPRARPQTSGAPAVSNTYPWSKTRIP